MELEIVMKCCDLKKKPTNEQNLVKVTDKMYTVITRAEKDAA